MTSERGIANLGLRLSFLAGAGIGTWIADWWGFWGIALFVTVMTVADLIRYADAKSRERAERIPWSGP